jgi:hypothetical protein
MELGPPREANSFSANQETVAFYYLVHKSLSLILILIKMNPITPILFL